MKNARCEIKISEKTVSEIVNSVVSAAIVTDNVAGILDGSYSFGPINAIFKKTVKDSMAESIAQIKSRMEELIPAETSKIIMDTVSAYRVKNGIENEIKILRRKLAPLNGNTIDTELMKAQLEIEIEEKNEELSKCKKDFLEKYQVALKETASSASELSGLYYQAVSVRTALNEYIDSEIDKAKAKIDVLRMMYGEGTLIEIVETSICEKTGSALTDDILKCARRNEPFIKVLVK